MLQFTSIIPPYEGGGFLYSDRGWLWLVLASMTLTELHEWVFSDLGFCGCGDPEGALDFLRTVLVAVRQRHDDNEIEESEVQSQERWSRNSDAFRELIGMDHAPAMAWTYLYFLDGKGLLEHGGNCSGSWLTEKGEEVLDALLKFDSRAIVDCDCDEEDENVLDAKVIG